MEAEIKRLKKRDSSSDLITRRNSIEKRQPFEIELSL